MFHGQWLPLRQQNSVVEPRALYWRVVWSNLSVGIAIALLCLYQIANAQNTNFWVFLSRLSCYRWNSWKFSLLWEAEIFILQGSPLNHAKKRWIMAAISWCSLFEPMHLGISYFHCNVPTPTAQVESIFKKWGETWFPESFPHFTIFHRHK